jgi:hypothetical protein
MDEVRHLLDRRIDASAESVERDLLRLVLTLVELIRQLVERQALRRIEDGDLGEAQVEGLGLALLRLDEAMRELRARYGFTPADLNLDLGPLGLLLNEVIGD